MPNDTNTQMTDTFLSSSISVAMAPVRVPLYTLLSPQMAATRRHQLRQRANHDITMLSLGFTALAMPKSITSSLSLLTKLHAR